MLFTAMFVLTFIMLVLPVVVIALVVGVLRPTSFSAGKLALCTLVYYVVFFTAVPKLIPDSMKTHTTKATEQQCCCEQR